MTPRLAFVTIGQTPRTDLVPELMAGLPGDVEAVEFGVLDGLDPDEIRALRPDAGGRHLVTRLRGGAQAVLDKDRIEARLRDLLGTIDPGDFLVLTLLCTGEFSTLSWPGLFLESQRIVDHGVAALAGGAPRLGVLVPLEEQTGEFHYRPRPGQEVRTAFASPYTDTPHRGRPTALHPDEPRRVDSAGRRATGESDRARRADDEPAADPFASAARALASADLVVMHCMGYTEAHRRRVAALTGRPVLLARRMVAAALGQIL